MQNQCTSAYHTRQGALRPWYLQSSIPLNATNSPSSSGSSTPPERLSPSPRLACAISVRLILSYILVAREKNLKCSSSYIRLAHSFIACYRKNGSIPHSQSYNGSVSSSPVKRVFTYYSQHTLKYAPNANGFEYARQPPSISDLLGSLHTHNIPSKIYRTPYYSKEIDAPERPREYAGLVYHLKGGEGIKNLPAWEPIGSENSLVEAGDVQGWEYAGHPPSVASVRAWLKSDEGNVLISGQNDRQRSQVRSRGNRLFLDDRLYATQIEGPTQANIYNFKTTPVDTGSVSRERPDMTVFSLEVFGRFHFPSG